MPSHTTIDLPIDNDTAVRVSNDLIGGALLALQLFELPEVKKVKKDLRDCFFVQRAPSESPEVMSTLDSAMDELSFAAMLAVAGGDKMNPKLNMYESLPYVAMGHRIPGSRYGFDNPDRVFRHFFVNPAYRYEIHGRRPKGSESINLLIEACEDKAPGWGYPLTFARLENIVTQPDGSFVITVDSVPTNGRSNHLWLPPGAAHVLIRDTYLDWVAESPTEIAVRRVSGPQAPALPFEIMAKLAPLQIIDYAMNGFKWYDLALAPLQANRIPIPQIRPAPPGEMPWGMTGVGRFCVADNEALVFTIDPQKSGYFGAMMATPWLVSVDASKHTSCLNNFQAAANPDGTITYVLAAHDPGVKNWLDTGGLHEGVMLFRWELVAGTLDPISAVRDVKVVKLGDLANALPFPIPTMSAEQRRKQIADRQLGFQRRLKALLPANAKP
jgi:hypothetical protein